MNAGEERFRKAQESLQGILDVIGPYLPAPDPVRTKQPSKWVVTTNAETALANTTHEQNLFACLS